MDNEYTFQDRFNTVWDLKIDFATARILDKWNFNEVTALKFSFLKPDREWFSEVFSNRPMAVAIAYAICRSRDDFFEKLSQNTEVTVDQLTREDDELCELTFMRRMDGKALKDCHRTLLKAIADFFPEQQTVLLSLVSKMDKVQERLKIELDQMDGELDKVLSSEMDQAVAESRRKLAEISSGQRGVKPSMLPAS